MMDQIIKSRNCRFLNLVLVVLGLTLSAFPSFLASAQERLPVLRNVGTIPVQWEGALAEPNASLNTRTPHMFDEQKPVIARAFQKAVEDAKRFRLLNPQLVAHHWQDEAGRNSLESRYELDAYVSLAVALDADVLIFTATLLSSKLDPLLIESHRVSAADLASKNESWTQELVKRLVFRLFNRLPFDVSVTSIQGNFITLSGGELQGLRKGDEVTLIAARVKSVHPATKAWLEFETREMGKAKIVDAKPNSAVVKLTHLNYEDGLAIGDGAKVPTITNRLVFSRETPSQFKDGSAKDPIIISPLYQDHTEKTAQSDTASSSLSPTKIAKPGADVQGDQADKSGKDEIAADDAEKTEEDDKWFKWPELEMPNVGVPDKLADDAIVHFGAYWWNASGPVSASSNFPWWLVNSGGISFSRKVFHKIRVGYGGGIAFGGTANSSFFGLEGHIRAYWQDDLNLGTPFIKSWKVGGHGSMSGLSVEEKYGGGDWIRGGVFGGLDGSITLVDLNQSYDWFAEAHISPLNVGRMGYEGSRRSIASALGWRFKLGAFQAASAGPIRFGGAIDHMSENISLQNNKRFSISEWKVLGLAKYNF